MPQTKKALTHQKPAAPKAGRKPKPPEMVTLSHEKLVELMTIARNFADGLTRFNAEVQRELNRRKGKSAQ